MSNSDFPQRQTTLIRFFFFPVYAVSKHIYIHVEREEIVGWLWQERVMSFEAQELLKIRYIVENL